MAESKPYYQLRRSVEDLDRSTIWVFATELGYIVDMAYDDALQESNLNCGIRH